MAPRRANRAAGSASAAAAAAPAAPSSAAPPDRLRRTKRTAQQSIRNITSRQNQLILQAREQFNARAGTSPSSRRAAVQPSAALEPGTVLTEDEKLQREVQDLMADIGEDTRDPEYLKL
ncbi:hypothetical protein PRIPAC_75137 [Pristionchus pacificus]|uniref:Uncharacterized protein n=1 Tax=Pristionchus pacificus TaxID=54126 RepID=A0A2A6CFT1_PRIPA|nr:hypothetical protein PRIPAC_75137 [Pristionchus pacificus]|eukprot:PDM77095.1 hypothetical protein PRIPAC_42490 [Pristionchus pacificus]